MHTARTLTSASFSVETAGSAGSLADVFPGFVERDRLGVVVRHPCGGVGASALILAAVTAFYDIQRARGGTFFIYPDYFLFHVGGRQGDHGMLDVWPAHKEVVVPGDAEEILRAINDRGITRLLVEDGEPGMPRFEPHTLASARARVLSALAYAPTGRVRGADVAVAGNDDTESYVRAVLERSEVALDRSAVWDDGRPVETYRRLGLDDALALLQSGGKGLGP